MEWPGKYFLMLFGCQRQNLNRSSEKLMVICLKLFLFYAIVNYQFETSEPKNVRSEWNKQFKP